MANCNQCGKEFKQVFKREKFCSRKCYGDSRKGEPVKLICETCGEIFYKKKYHVKEGITRFCSKKCSQKSRKKYHEEVRACLYCGEEFTVLNKSRKRCCCCDCAAKIRSIIRREKELKKLEEDFNKLYDTYVTKVQKNYLEEII